MKRPKGIHIPKKWVGAAALGGLLLLSAVLSFPPAVAKVTNILSANAERKLPIYCVQTDAPKVSVSFDAAWGAGKNLPFPKAPR